MLISGYSRLVFSELRYKLMHLVMSSRLVYIYAFFLECGNAVKDTSWYMESAKKKYEKVKADMAPKVERYFEKHTSRAIAYCGRLYRYALLVEENGNFYSMMAWAEVLSRGRQSSYLKRMAIKAGEHLTREMPKFNVRYYGLNGCKKAGFVAASERFLGHEVISMAAITGNSERAIDRLYEFAPEKYREQLEEEFKEALIEHYRKKYAKDDYYTE